MRRKLQALFPSLTVFVTFIYCWINLQAQTTIIKDIDTITTVEGVNPSDLTPFKNGILFSGNTVYNVNPENYTTTLCFLDTSTLTITPLSYNTWAGPIRAFSIVVLDTIALFSGSDVSDLPFGAELWRTNGSFSGTYKIKDISSGGYSSLYGKKIVCNGIAYFEGADDAFTHGLWRSDGTSVGTYEVKRGVRSLQKMIVMNNILYFYGFDGIDGMELWRSDGTTNGTYKLLTLPSEVAYDFYDDMVQMNGILYFSAYDGGYGTELWRSDGTSAGTDLVKDIYPGHRSSNPADLTAIQNKLFFSANDSIHGTELWISDGTMSGTHMVKDINNIHKHYSDPSNIVNLNGVALFGARDTMSGRELWRSDGTDTGTYLVKDIYPGEHKGFFGNMSVINGIAYFAASDSGAKQDLWRSDGTSEGTYKIKDFTGPDYLNPNNFIGCGNKICFTASGIQNGIQTQNTLWITDGTARGTYPIEILRYPNSSSPSNLTLVGDKIYFFTVDRENSKGGFESPYGNRLWITDGTEGGTKLIRKFGPNYFTYQTASFVNTAQIDGKFMFFIYSGPNKLKLYISGGTDSSTILLNNSLIAEYSSRIVSYNNNLFFQGCDSAHGCEPWITDGTPEGTHLLFDVRPGPDGSYPPSFTSYKNQLFFAAGDSIGGSELWSTDGTTNGTQKIEINLGTDISFVGNPCVYRDSLYFANSSYGILWRTDGTTAGSQAIATIGDGVYACDIGPMTVCGSYLFFWAKNGLQGLQLWRTDGSKKGTILLKTFGTTGHFYDVTAYDSIGSKLFFWLDTAIAVGGIGLGLYETDGSVSGTFEVPEHFDHFTVHSLTSDPFGFDGHYLYFDANSDTLGDELWRTDGNTFQVIQDIYPGIYGSRPSDFTILNNQLIFAATDPIHGRELRKLDLPFNTGINPIVFPMDSSDINIYPNPFSNITHLYIDQRPGEYQVQVFNLYGIPVELHHINGNPSLDIGADLKQGVYFVQLITKDKTFTKEIIKIK